MTQNRKTGLIEDILSGRLTAIDAFRMMSTERTFSLGINRTAAAMVASGAPSTEDAVRIARQIPLAQVGYRW